MIGWAIAVVWILLGIGVMRRVAYMVAHDFGQPDLFDVMLGLAAGAVTGLCAPVVVPLYLLYQSGLLHKGTHAFLKAPGHIRREQEREGQQKRIWELEREQRERDYRVLALERELGIGQGAELKNLAENQAIAEDEAETLSTAGRRYVPIGDDENASFM